MFITSLTCVKQVDSFVSCLYKLTSLRFHYYHSMDKQRMIRLMCCRVKRERNMAKSTIFDTYNEFFS
jgi:putative alpha-1,2-mannosidase